MSQFVNKADTLIELYEFVMLRRTRIHSHTGMLK